jgi:predicted TIM-barrel fold metal-dependent hydrolase
VPLQESMQVISVDDHLLEPKNVWIDRLPSKWQERGPHVVSTDEGDAWVWEDRKYLMPRNLAVVGQASEDWGNQPLRFAEIRPGCYDPVARLADMDEDGVYAQLCFPTWPRFAGTRFLEKGDRELALLCVKAWNDFVFDEWCAAAPDRYIPMIILPLWDIFLSVAELERCADRGARAISFPESPTSLGLPSFHSGEWDRVLAAATAAQLPLCMHFGTSGVDPVTAPDSPYLVRVSLFGTTSMAAATDLVFSPVFTKFPDLKVAMSEGGIGWIPYLMEKVETVWHHHAHYNAYVGRERNPAEVFRKHIYGCFIEDDFGIEARDKIGIENIMFESDYPHSDSTWPKSRKRLADGLANVPDEEASLISEMNARMLFRFPRRVTTS